jgi:hypothetical protein
MAGKKVDLTTLGERVKVDVPPAEPAPVASNTPAQPAAQPAATHHTSRRETRRSAKTPAPGQWVRYDELERKETRLRTDQYGQLSDLSRRLNRLRAGQGERITENTLIRVAIDLLLGREPDLAGTTELELRKSVGL